jgi:hypothetical protein
MRDFVTKYRTQLIGCALVVCGCVLVACGMDAEGRAAVLAGLADLGIELARKGGAK